ncbi:MAG: phosphoglyceromutase [Methylothermaceae bacteria B42]|nr:MAG: phosphoglyceromutase [Methylothermaceae bacteria B42]HHJ38923.1 2,3-bisphosphoglycerate-dependent phosphoglycerate mutase [Methylothermaceae bacterium]
MARLILVRHGQSIWNLQNRFTGWVDVSLSRHGMEEAERVGKRLANERFDVAFTSMLIRAQDTLYEILKQNRFCDQYVRIHEQSREWYEHFIPAPGDLAELKIYTSEKLNERYYGDLQGLNKDKAREQYGHEQVHLWRRSYDVPPPNGESLKMTAERVLPYYHAHIEPELRAGKEVLVSAHGNSLRALVMHIETLSPEEIIQREIPTGTPIIYTFSPNMELKGISVLD